MEFSGGETLREDLCNKKGTVLSVTLFRESPFLCDFFLFTENFSDNSHPSLLLRPNLDEIILNLSNQICVMVPLVKMSFLVILLLFFYL